MGGRAMEVSRVEESAEIVEVAEFEYNRCNINNKNDNDNNNNLNSNNNSFGTDVIGCRFQE